MWDMRYAFENSSFNNDIASWDTGKVRLAISMFRFTPVNQYIGEWDMGSAEDTI